MGTGKTKGRFGIYRGGLTVVATTDDRFGSNITGRKD
jgi:hypothetical protein